MATTSTSYDEDAHFHEDLIEITFGVVTVSDRCYGNESINKSGPVLEKIIKTSSWFKGKILSKATVPDNVSDIEDILIRMSDVDKVDVIITTGGTGFAPRDVTPEATKKVIHKEATALSVAITIRSLAITPKSMFSRATCGIRGSTIIINVPGKPSAVKECFDVFCQDLGHAVGLLRPEKFERSVMKKKSCTVTQDLPNVCSQKYDHFIDKLRLGIDNALLGPLDQERSNKFLLEMESTMLPGDESSLISELENTVKQKHITLSSKVRVDNVAGRPRESNFPLVSVQDALKMIEDHASPNGFVEKVLNNDAILGFVLYEDICASSPHPPFPASIKDGYAVIASDGCGPRKVCAKSLAGYDPEHTSIISSGYCVRINTGAPVPPGVDAVVQVEDTHLIAEDNGEETEIEILVPPKVGQDIRSIGSDILENQIVVAKNSVIGPGEIAVAATVGKVQFKVFKKPVVAVLTTGNEIVEPFMKPKPGQIRDCNKSALLAFFTSKGFSVSDGKISSDDPDDLKKCLEKLLSISDVLVITGGVSMGEKDYVKQVLEADFGVKIHFGRVFMKPGKPTTFGTITYQGSRKLIFGLPGNPVSALVTAQLFVVPALLQMSGFKKTTPTVIKAKLSTDLKHDLRPEYVRAKLEWSSDSNIPTVSPSTSHQISSNVCSVVGVNALIAIPPKSDNSSASFITSGSIVDVLIIGQV